MYISVVHVYKILLGYLDYESSDMSMPSICSCILGASGPAGILRDKTMDDILMYMPSPMMVKIPLCFKTIG